MRIDGVLTDEAVLAELGERLARVRLERNISQSELGEQAGVGRTAVQRIEAGLPVMTTSLVRVLRALEILDALDVAVPQRTASPIAELASRRRGRRRASGTRVRQDAGPNSGWSWGEGTPESR
jgi:transcriptional regulator with XRE-family HTH domain